MAELQIHFPLSMFVSTNNYPSYYPHAFNRGQEYIYGKTRSQIATCDEAQVILYLSQVVFRMNMNILE